jgi:prefoldin beta subunit
MEDSNKKMQEMQLIEQSLQNILLQKQAFQMELSESKSALNEIQSSDDDVFKIVGQLMIKTDKKKITEELESKEKLLDLRLKSLDKQESSLSERLEKLRDEIINIQK